MSLPTAFFTFRLDSPFMYKKRYDLLYFIHLSGSGAAVSGNETALLHFSPVASCIPMSPLPIFTVLGFDPFRLPLCRRGSSHIVPLKVRRYFFF